MLVQLIKLNALTCQRQQTILRRTLTQYKSKPNILAPKIIVAATLTSKVPHIDSPPKWINTSGLLFKELAQGSVPPKIHVKYIIDEARSALTKATAFRRDYALEVHKESVESLQEKWKSSRYDWLPTFAEIPKHMGERMPDDEVQLHTTSLENALKNTYEYLQKTAVALEQVVWDMEAHLDSDFLVQFRGVEHQLRRVLCSIEMAIAGFNLKPKKDVERKIMPDWLRKVEDPKDRAVRDWIVYRDYINALEYTVQMFETFEKVL